MPNGSQIAFLKRIKARQRSIRKVYYEFVTRTYPYPDAAARPGCRVVGGSDLAVQDSTGDGQRIDDGNGGRAVSGFLGRDDDSHDVPLRCPRDPGRRAGPA